MRKKLYINGVDTSAYGIYISSDTYLDAPQISYNEYDVPGRNGNVIQFNKKMNNIVRKFSCYLPKESNYISGINSLKKLLYANPGYLRIESDYDPDTYQMGYLAQEINVKPFNDKASQFDLYFSCEPQKHFKTTDSESLAMSTTNGLVGIYSRNSRVMKWLFSVLPVEYIPNDDYFIIYGSPITEPSSYSHINASWSGGDTFAAVILSNYQTFEEFPFLQLYRLVAYSNTSISSATSSYGGFIRFIVPLKTSGTYTLSYRGATIGNDSMTINLGSMAKSMANSDALGIHLTAEIGYKILNSYTQGTYIPNAVGFTSYYNSTEKETASVVLHMEDMDADTLTKLSDYASSGVYRVFIDFESKECYLHKTGMPDIPFGGFLSIEGSISNMGVDEIKAVAFKGNVIDNVTMSSGWWTV